MITCLTTRLNHYYDFLRKTASHTKVTYTAIRNSQRIAIQWFCITECSNILCAKCYFFYAPAIYNGGGGHIASALSVRTKNGFRAISFEYIGVLDSYFIHGYIIIKYRSSSITGKIHLLLSELWPLISE